MLKRFIRSIRISTSMFLNHLKKELQLLFILGQMATEFLNQCNFSLSLITDHATTAHVVSLTYGKGCLTGGGM